MAGSKSNYLENKVLNLLLGGTAYSIPSTLYVGLWCSADGTLDDASDGSSAGEIDTSGTAYERVAIANDNTTWGAVTTTGSRSNAIAITFPTATATWGSANVDQFAILDATTGGNILFWSDLAVPKTVTSGDSIQFNIGDLTINEN